MTGKEPAAFNFVDLTTGVDGNEVICPISTSAAPAATEPIMQPNDDTCSRAAVLHMLQHRRAHQGQPRRLIRGQGYALRHPERSSTMNINKPNDGQVRQGISNDQCRTYLDHQGGGSSEARGRLPLEPQSIQPAALVELADDSIPDITYTPGNHLTHARVTPEHTQVAADNLDRMKRAQEEEARRQKEANEEQARLFQQQRRDLMRLKEVTQQQDVLFEQQTKQVKQEQQQAAMFLARESSRSRNGHNEQMNPHCSRDQVLPRPSPQTPFFPRPQAPFMNIPTTNDINIYNNMKHGNATAAPGSLVSQQQQHQHFPAGHPPNHLSGEGSTLTMQHCGVTSELALYYASMVTVFDNVSVEQAEAVCQMLAGKESKYWAPRKIFHHAFGPPLDPSLMSQPTLVSPQMSAPHCAQAWPSQTPPRAQSGPSQAPLTAQAGPPQAPQALPFAEAGPSRAPPALPFAEAGPSRAPPALPFAQAGPSRAPPALPFAQAGPSRAPPALPFAQAGPSQAHPLAQARPSHASPALPFAQAGPSRAPPALPFAEAGPSQAPEALPFAQAGPSRTTPNVPGPESSQAKDASLTRFLEKKKGRVISTDNREEDNVPTMQISHDNAVGQPGPSSAETWHHDQRRTLSTTPATPPGTSSSKRKIAHGQDATMDSDDLYMRAGGSGDYILVQEDVKPASKAADYIRTTSENVMREYEAILKDFDR